MSPAAWPRHEQWLAGGRRVDLPGLGHSVFVRTEGPASSPPLTVLHGFPTSSHDFALVLPALTANRHVLLFDFVGFGDSDKPQEHPYSVIEQADLVQELWERLGLAPGGLLVAHDYGVSVAQELLARGVAVDGIAWMNGGIYPDLHRPTDAQKALAGPDGAQIARSLTPELIAPGLSAILAQPLPDEVLADLVAALAGREGIANIHLLLGYVRERREHGERWVQAFESFAGPSAFIWGMRDPVSGAHMLARIRERRPRAIFTELDQVGHYPQLEAADAVAAALGDFVAGHTFASS